MEKRTIYVFGNPDIEMDAIPLRLIPLLKEKFPDVVFSVLDPNENWDIAENIIVIDTIAGIEHVMLFDGLSSFAPSANVSVHDFDAYANLRLLEKLGKLKNIKVIGVPMGANANFVYGDVERELSLL